MKKFRDVMLDLETLGTNPGCIVLSIGAVYFDPETKELGPEFYTTINTIDSHDRGLKSEEATAAWWRAQAPEAKVVINQAWCSDTFLPEALNQFARFLRKYDWQRTKVWGNGADFDNAILAACYAAIGQTPPWEFWNNRCYRTLKGLKPGIRISNRHGIYHNALDDAKTQAYHAMMIFEELKNG